MSKGMWTKHFTLEGKEFYFNASQNRSLWTPPSDSIIHRAPNLKPPESIEEKGDSTNSVSQVKTQSLELENGEIPNIIASQPPPPPGLPPHKLPEMTQTIVSEQQKNQQMLVHSSRFNHDHNYNIISFKILGSSISKLKLTKL